MKKICLGLLIIAFSCSEQKKKKEQSPSILITSPNIEIFEINLAEPSCKHHECL
jgi:hypothetical protein